MTVYRLRSSIVWKPLKEKIGILDTDSAEFYLLDEIASAIFRKILENNLEQVFMTDKEQGRILEHLAEIGVLQTV